MYLGDSCSLIHYSCLMNTSTAPPTQTPRIRAPVQAIPRALSRLIASPPRAASDPIASSPASDGAPRFYPRHVPTSWWLISASILSGLFFLWIGGELIYIFTFMDMGDGARGMDLVLNSHSIIQLGVIILVGVFFGVMGLFCFRHTYRVIRQRSASRQGTWPFGLYVLPDVLFYYDWAPAKRRRCTLIPGALVGRITSAEGRVTVEVESDEESASVVITPPLPYYGKAEELASELEKWKDQGAQEPTA